MYINVYIHIFLSYHTSDLTTLKNLIIKLKIIFSLGIQDLSREINERKCDSGFESIMIYDTQITIRMHTKRSGSAALK